MWVIIIHTINLIWLGGNLTGHLLQTPEHEIENSLPSQYQPPLRIIFQFNYVVYTKLSPDPEGKKDA